jgi:hypothetical protein
MQQVGSNFAPGATGSSANSAILLTALLTASLTTRRPMISDPKLPFASEPTSVGDLKSPPETSAPAGSPLSPMPVSRPSPSMERRSATYLWLRRIGVLSFVFLCATLGVMLMILPWRPEWSENPLLLPYPTLHAVMASGFARGASTGLGLLNVWIGFWEAMQYRED